MANLFLKLRTWFRDLPLHLKMFWFLASLIMISAAASGQPQNLIFAVVSIIIVGFVWLMAIGIARGIADRARSIAGIAKFFVTKKSAPEDREAERGSTHVNGDQLARMLKKERQK